MSKFSNIQIAEIVALHPQVEVHKFFGLFEYATYQGTHSRIESYRNFYNKPEALSLVHIADAPKESLLSASELQANPDGNYRVDLCISKDCKFAAFQVFERKGSDFEPFSKLCILEGEEASTFEKLLA